MKLISKKKRLLKNTIYLYVLTFSTQILNLITIPYQTRVLGPEIYGTVGFAISIMSYVQLILDFGFILSATESVANCKGNKEKISTIFSIVTVYKAFCGILLFLILFLICKSVSTLSNQINLIMLYGIAYWINSFLPDYIYRGIEKMGKITIRTLFVKIFFTCMIFLFLKEKNDYLILPLLLIFGNLLSVFYSWFDIYRSYNIKFIKFSVIELIGVVKKSLPFFCSRIASTFYQAMNTLILGYFWNGKPVVGYYSSADKLVSLSKSFSSPIADSLYPYMIKNKDFNLIKKVMILFMPIIFILSVFCFIFAEPICVFLFGANFRNTASILRCLLPIIIVILPSYILCFPVLNPLGLSKYANLSNIIGAFIQVIIILFLIIFDMLNVYTICIASSITEVTVFAYRLYIVVNRKTFIERIKKNEKNYQNFG